MARIVMNGSLKIIPEQPPALVKAHRDVRVVHRMLQEYKDRFSQSDLQRDISPLMERALAIRNEYISSLLSCEKAMQKQLPHMPPSDKSYYMPVLTFISRAREAHSVVPFILYLDRIAAEVENINHFGPRTPSIWPFRGYEDFHAFLLKRIDDSIETCRSYLALLSNSLDSFVSAVDVNSVLLNMFEVQKLITLTKATSRDKEKQQYLDAQIQESKFTPGEINPVQNISPLTFFFLQQIISNAFKASVLAQKWQREGTHPLREEYSSLPPISNPRVEVSTKKGSKGSVIVTLSDNGLGMTKERMQRIFVEEWGYFGYYLPSNSCSMRIFPFVADLTGTHIEVHSEIGKGTTFTLTIPSLN